MLNHTPSGLFTPSIDSFGRVIFTRWDHLQRDQQADTDATAGGSNGTFHFADESANAARLAQSVEVFPEPRGSRTDLLAGTNLEGNSINHFFPWEINEDGTSEETVNHVGRHELFGYFDRSMSDSGLSGVSYFDPDVLVTWSGEMWGAESGRSAGAAASCAADDAARGTGGEDLPRRKC